MSDTSTVQGQEPVQTPAPDTNSTQSPPVGQQEPVQQTGQDLGQETTEITYPENNLYAQYLAEIQDEVQRKLLEPHAKRWNGLVTRQFQKIREEYKPYKESGLTAETAAQAAQLYQRLLNDPIELMHAIAEATGQRVTLQQVQQAQQQQTQQQVQPSQASNGNTAQEDAYAEWMDQAAAAAFKKMEGAQQQQHQLLTKLAEYIVGQQQIQQKAQQDAELDFTLQKLQELAPGIDQEFALTKLYAGHGVEQVAAQWKALGQNLLAAHQQQQPAPSPPFMGGGSAPINAQGFDPKTAGSKDLQGIVASLVAQAQQAG